MKKYLCLLLLLLLCLASLASLELRQGNIKIVVDERSGMFSVYQLLANNSWQSLLYDEESKTSYPTVMVDQKTFKLGEAAEFRTVVTSTADKIVIEHKASFCTVIQELSFIKSDNSRTSNGLLVSASITNSGERDVSAGLRYLLDTWLGEEGGKHFLTSSGTQIANETLLSASQFDTGIISSADSKTGLVVLPAGTTGRPDSMLLANWKRLNDASWSFDVARSRNFTLLPYSINDSALALYFNSATIRPGASRTLSFIVGTAYTGAYASSLVAKQAEAQVISQLLQDSSKVELNIGTDATAAKELMTTINTLLGASGAIDSAELERLKTLVETLETRKGSY